MEKFAGLPVLLVGPFTDKLLKKYRNQIIGHKWGDYLNCESGYEILGRPLMDDPIHYKDVYMWPLAQHRHEVKRQR